MMSAPEMGPSKTVATAVVATAMVSSSMMTAAMMTAAVMAPAVAATMAALGQCGTCQHTGQRHRRNSNDRSQHLILRIPQH